MLRDRHGVAAVPLATYARDFVKGTEQQVQGTIDAALNIEDPDELGERMAKRECEDDLRDVPSEREKRGHSMFDFGYGKSGWILTGDDDADVG